MKINIQSFFIRQRACMKFVLYHGQLVGLYASTQHVHSLVQQHDKLQDEQQQEKRHCLQLNT